MQVRFWGVRGSVPTPGPRTVRYGGNTPCTELETNSGQMIIIDMGTGLRELGNDLMRRGIGAGGVQANIFLSHTHWDHIHGWPFFVPAFIPGNRFTIHGPVSGIDETLEDVVGKQMLYSYFPVKLDYMAAEVNFIELKEEEITLGDVKIKTQYLNHPILCLGYRFEADGCVFVYASDTEPYHNVFAAGAEDLDDEFAAEAQRAIDDMNLRTLGFIKDADLVIHDAQYTAKEYSSKVGWGHTSLEDVVDNATKANVKRVAMYHHDPERSDDDLLELEQYATKIVQDRGLDKPEVFAATEGKSLEL